MIKKLFILSVIMLIFTGIYITGVLDYLSLDNLKENRLVLLDFYHLNKLIVIGAYSLVYILTTALSIPGATILTLAGGAIFGTFLGTGLVVISATLGATSAFLVSRYILRTSLEAKYKEKLSGFNQGVQENAFQYVLFLRLIPAFPFFLINVILGLTRLKTNVFFWGSLIGMLPGTFVYVNAGRQVSTISQVSDIATPEVLGAFILLGCLAMLPVLYQKIKKGKNV